MIFTHRLIYPFYRRYILPAIHLVRYGTRRRFHVSPGVSFHYHTGISVPLSPFYTPGNEACRELQAFLKHSRGKYRLLDVGALFGVFSLAFTADDKRRQALAVDPSSVAAIHLPRQTRLNPGLSIDYLRAAVGAHGGTVRVMQQQNHALVSSDIGKGNEVPLVTIDELVRQYRFEPDIIKIDVEGYEHEVLKGAAAYLASNKPLIFLELHASLLTHYSSGISQTIHLLETLGYRFQNLKGEAIEAASLAGDSRIICLSLE